MSSVMGCVKRGQVQVGALLDVGAGLGISTHYFSAAYTATGVDVSSVAVGRASETYPHLDFFTCDVCGDNVLDARKWDIVVLNQLLWYTIHKFEYVLKNLNKLLASDGIVLLSNFIFSAADQKFAREHFSGHTEIVTWLASIAAENEWFLTDYVCYPLDNFYYDFHAVLKKH